MSSSHAGHGFRLPRKTHALSRLPEVTVWEEIMCLAAVFGEADLGHGCPDWCPPPFLLDAVKSVGKAANEGRADAGPHGPAPSLGDINLLHALRDEYSCRLLPPKTGAATRALDAAGEILVTVGASQALALAICAVVNPGDEVILIEPAFDVYAGAVQIAGGNCVYVQLRSSHPDIVLQSSRDLVLHAEDLEASITPHTKLLILNTPHNPTGKVFTRGELESIACVLSRAPRVAVLADEVYEHMTFDPKLPHVSIASLSDDMFNRTVSIYSAGKTFSATGWKVGWGIGPHSIIKRMQVLQENSVGQVPTLLQRAFAVALRKARTPYGDCETYYNWLQQMYKTKRDSFITTLKNSAKGRPVVPDGTYYVMGALDAGAFPSEMFREPPPSVMKLIRDKTLAIDGKTSGRLDYNYCRSLAVNERVIAIPISAFFSADSMKPGVTDRLVRFSICKDDETLQTARRHMLHAHTI